MKLSIWPILRDVWRAYRAHWKLLIALSVLLLAPQAAADAFLGEIEIEKVENLNDVLKLASVPFTLGINLFGEALYSGIIAVLIVKWRNGEQLGDLREHARTIPYGRLIAIDILIVFAVAAGLILLIIPGVLAFTYLLIAPALVEINKLTIRQAIRQSVELVRGSFWRVLGFALVVLALSDGFTAVLEAPLHGVKGEIVFNLGVHALLEPFQGLATVLLALALIDLKAARTASAG
ncbi:MAG: hypothetical protein M3O25_03155 [Actinomycetota bacterium]|nr:hypothetical protein [Actinomycetota bacterium]